MQAVRCAALRNFMQFDTESAGRKHHIFALAKRRDQFLIMIPWNWQQLARNACPGTHFVY